MSFSFKKSKKPMLTTSDIIFLYLIPVHENIELNGSKDDRITLSLKRSFKKLSIPIK